MSPTPNPAAAQTFMVVATIRDDTNFTEFAALRDDEQKQLEVLRSDGRTGAHYVSPARRATFIEVIIADEKQVNATAPTVSVASLTIDCADPAALDRGTPDGTPLMDGRWCPSISVIRQLPFVH